MASPPPVQQIDDSIGMGLRDTQRVMPEESRLPEVLELVNRRLQEVRDLIDEARNAAERLAERRG
jgi:hypothetical protein